MAHPEDMIRFQAEHHPMEATNRFGSKEDYCLYLMHLKAYEEIAAFASAKNVLDLGCNNGWGTLVLSHSARAVTGVDVSDISLAEARRNACAPNIEYIKVDGDRLPFPDGHFDLVASCQVIEHVADYAPYLGEILRVLTPNGIAVFTTPNARIRLDPGMKPWFPFHVREFSGAELGELLQAWFGRVDVRGLSATPELYEIEFKRVQRSRERARRRRKLPLPAYVDLRTRTIDAIKSLLPTPVIRGIKKIVRNVEQSRNETRPTQSAVDPAILQGYSSKDLSYVHERIDESLDLMAVCHKIPT